jgi:hypothetical protein
VDQEVLEVLFLLEVQAVPVHLEALVVLEVQEDRVVRIPVVFLSRHQSLHLRWQHLAPLLYAWRRGAVQMLLLSLVMILLQQVA